MQLDMKALQDDVEEEKAEKETPIHVGLHMLLCSITISIPRLQTLLNKSYWHLLLSLFALAKALQGGGW